MSLQPTSSSSSSRTQKRCMVAPLPLYSSMKNVDTFFVLECLLPPPAASPTSTALPAPPLQPSTSTRAFLIHQTRTTHSFACVVHVQLPSHSIPAAQHENV